MNAPRVTAADTLTFGPVPPAEARNRLDAWLARSHPGISRARWQELIRGGHVTVGGQPRKANYSLVAGDTAVAVIPPAIPVEVTAEDIALEILHEDADIIVINKPPRLVVHPAPGHASGTLVNALLHHCHDLSGIGGEIRPGIVHRLDQDTSGALVVAKNETAMLNLAAQFKNRATRKEYIAMVWGTPQPPSGIIRTTIGRDPVHRQKMSTRSTRGRDAVSRYRVMKTLDPASLVAVTIETGRTHQIRVHLAHLKHPVVGDLVYGRKNPPALPAPVTRQLLHAWKLSFTHPRTGEPMTLEAPWPDDIKNLIAALQPPA
jgi:23S rRNA pseudouridine1911/1915/1917 synthase